MRADLFFLEELGAGGKAPMAPLHDVQNSARLGGFNFF